MSLPRLHAPASARAITLAALGLLAATPALAQPDAGQLLNQQQRQAPPPPPSRPAADEPAKPAQADDATVFKALIRSVRVTGAQGLASDAELQATVAGAVGQRLSHAELQALAARVTALLQRLGHPLALAYLPRQDLSAGELEIAVLRGRLEGEGRGVQITNRSAVPTPQLQAIADAALGGEELRNADLERAVLLMNDLAGVSARARLERGQAAGTSRLMVNVEPTAALRGEAGVDNFVNRYTGSARASVRASWANPLQRGDSLSVAANTSEGNQGLQLGYSLPLAPNGLRLQAGASALRYEIGQELEPLGLEGRARAVNLGLSLPWLRTREASLWLAADLEHKALRDDSTAGNLRDRRLQRVQFSAYGSGWDERGFGGGTSGSLSLGLGRVDLGRNAADAAQDGRTAGTEGGYGKLALQASRLQLLDARGRWALFGSLSAQFAGHNLDSSEKFVLGGPSGVRAHPVGEGSGDDGWLVTAELRRELGGLAALPGSQVQALAFVDTGAVRLHRRPWAGAQAPGRSNQVALSGIGLGVNAVAGPWQLRAAVARGTDDRSALQADGRNADGRRARSRAWLQLSASF
jgi:hemolysin activation/secretion protein